MAEIPPHKSVTASARRQKSQQNTLRIAMMPRVVALTAATNASTADLTAAPIATAANFIALHAGKTADLLAAAAAAVPVANAVANALSPPMLSEMPSCAAA